VRSLDDLRKTKVWVWSDDPTMVAMATVVGVHPVSLDIADVLTALQTGMIDTVFTTPSGAIALQWFTKVKTMTRLPLTVSTGGLLVDRKQFLRLSPEHQQTVREVCRRFLRELTLVTRREDQEALEVLQEKGIEIIEPSESLRKEFEVVAQKVVERLKGKAFSEEAYARLREAVAAARAAGKADAGE